MKQVSKVKCSCLVIFLIMMLALCACKNDLEDSYGIGNRPALSEEIFLSVSIGGGDVYLPNNEIYVMSDGRVEIYVEGEFCDDSIYIDDMDGLREMVDRDKLLRLHVEDSDGCDGETKYITLYDVDGNELKRVGGYMVQNKKFNEMYSAIVEAIGPSNISRVLNNY